MDQIRGVSGRCVLWGLWLGVLIPLSVEEVWNIPVGHYDLRVQYLFTALAAGLGMILAAGGWRKPTEAFGLGALDLRGQLGDFLRSPFVIALLLFGLVGILGAMNSENLKRTVFYWIWTLGTLAALPLLMATFLRGLGPWVPRTAAIALILQTAVILIDTLICMGSPEGPYLGRVWQGQPGACRPHAFYHEPNFFAIYALLAMVWMRQWWTLDPDPRWRRFFVAAWIITALGVFLCTSRLGWAVLGGVLGIEALATALWARKAGGRHLKWVLAGALVSVLVAVGIASRSQEMGRMLRSVEGIIQGNDGSLKHRRQYFAIAESLFQAHPLVGVGPGAGGAYLVAHFPDHPSLPPAESRDPGFVERVRNNPTTHSVYTELMAEWGLLGGLAFAAFVILLLAPARGVILAHAAWTIALVFSTQQTLPRYDVWAAIALVAAGLRLSPGTRRSPSGARR